MCYVLCYVYVLWWFKNVVSDEEYGEKSVSVLLDGEESELVFIDTPDGEVSVRNMVCARDTSPLKNNNKVMIFGAALGFPIIWFIWCQSAPFLAKSINM